jgi:phage terminase large subunit
VPLLFQPARYKVAYGGRGSGKSWGFARALLIQGLQRPMRILCAREFQKSIKQSVHTLLVDQLQAMGFGKIYKVTEDAITAPNGTVFNFTGLAYHTVESIKSYEGVDVVWIEEGQTVTKRSWDILIPTIRAKGSEIWVSFNPDLDTDETYQRFVVEPPESARVVKINWSDNPWFPEELELERLDCYRRRPQDYANIWEGECRSAVEGAIYANEIRDAVEHGRVTNVPYDPGLKVHVVFDLGWNDAMFVSLVQRGVSDIRIIRCIEDSHRTLESYSRELRDLGLNWGRVWLPHDGLQKDIKTGRSAQQYLQALGWDVAIVPQGSIEAGIRVARETFPRVWWDKQRAGVMVERLKRYRRVVPQTTGEPGKPLHDDNSHGADCFRYVCAAADQMSNEEYGEAVVDYERAFAHGGGWMAA